MSDELSRQRLWQLRMAKQKRCQDCGRKPLLSKARCRACLLKNRLRVRQRQNNQPKRKGGRGRPSIAV